MDKLKNVFKTIGFVLLLILICFIGCAFLGLILPDSDAAGGIVFIYLALSIIAIVFATRAFIKNDCHFKSGDSYLPPYKEAETKLSEAKALAEKINNSSVDVNAFLNDYNELCECLDRLIWLTEIEGISMTPTPRENKERIVNNLPAIVNDFIDRSIAKINSESDYSLAINWLNCLRYNENFKAMSSEKVEAHINNLLYFINHLSSAPKGAYDDLLPLAIDTVFETKQVSVSMLQRRLILGYPRACHIVDQMEELGIAGPFEGSKPREILISQEIWAAMRDEFIDYISRSGSVLTHEIEDKGLAREAFENEDEWRRAQLGLSPAEYALYKVDSMDGHQFEHWCADILSKNGFVNASVTPASNDQGVDVLAEKDGIKYAIQCKCYSSDLGNTPVQEVNTGKVIYHCHVGVVMTNRHFTTGAKKAADATGVLLWDRDYITTLLEKSNDNSSCSVAPQVLSE